MNERRADFELLRDFVRSGNQTGFAELIHRHLDLVYATAQRKLTDEGAAEEITQNVFAILARKAWRFGPDDSLPAWLHRTALLESKSWLRGELRRRRREQTAAELGTTMKSPDEHPSFSALLPQLDEALLSLRDKDRTALLLRFYESRSLRDVGASLGVKEDAAQKRVAAALEKLARFFQRRGFRTATIAATTAALQHTAASAPSFMAVSVAQAALKNAPGIAGPTALLSRLLSLSKFQKALLCVVILTAPVLWHWLSISPRDPAQVAPGEPLATPQSEVVPVSEVAGLQPTELAPETPPPAERAVEPRSPTRMSTAARLTGLVDLPGFKAAFLEVAYPVTNYSAEFQGGQEVMRTNFLFLKEGESSVESLWMRQMTIEILQVNFRRAGVEAREDGRDVFYSFGPYVRKIPNIRFQETRLKDLLLLYGSFVNRTVLCHPALKQAPITAEISTKNKEVAAMVLRRVFEERGIMTSSLGTKFELFFPKEQLREVMNPIRVLPPAAADAGEDVIPSGAIQLRELGLPQTLAIYGELIGRKLAPDNLPSGSPIFLVNQTPLSRTELIYAFDIFFGWQGLKAVFAGEDSFRIIPLRDR